MKSENEEANYLEECKEVLDYFGVDFSGDTIECSDAGNMKIMSDRSKFIKLFKGQSINGVAGYVARHTNKRTLWAKKTKPEKK